MVVWRCKDCKKHKGDGFTSATTSNDNKILDKNNTNVMLHNHYINVL